MTSAEMIAALDTAKAMYIHVLASHISLGDGIRYNAAVYFLKHFYNHLFQDNYLPVRIDR